MTGRPPAESWSAKAHIRLGLVCIVLLGVGLGGWGATARLEGAVISSGRLRVESRRQVVQHPDGGVVREILVREGDRVEAGEVLIRLDGRTFDYELAVLESELHEAMARRGRLEAEQAGRKTVTFDAELVAAAERAPAVRALLEGQRTLFEARRKSLANSIAALRERQAQTRDEIAGAGAAIAALKRQRDLIGKELAAQRQLLRKGLAQSSRVLELEREAARLEGEQGRLEAEAARLRGRVAELKIELVSIRASRREEALSELRDLGVRELELRERRIVLRERLSRLDVRAPLEGVVLDMTVHGPEAVVRPAEPILHIVPTGSTLVVDAEVDPTHIDAVHAGQDAVLRFPAFNARTTPVMNGTVARVSADAFLDPETRRSFYRAEVLMEEGAAARLGERRLLAGMPVEVFIRTGARTPLEYLVKPIVDHLARAMREQ